MKFITSIVSVLFCITFLHAQELDVCHILVENVDTDHTGYSSSTDRNMLGDFEPVTFRIFFWGVKDDNGNSLVDFTLENATNAVQELNKIYEEGQISFELAGIQEINSTEYNVLEDRGDFFDLYNYAVSNNYINDNAFNVYVSSVYQGFGGIALSFNETVIGIPIFHLIQPGVLTHEVGHCFNLRHTNNGANLSACEIATRDPNHPYYNADTNGDFVADTDAAFEFNSTDLDASQCNYIGQETDCIGENYRIPSELLRNYMTVRASSCPKDIMTPGQFIRIRETIALDPTGSFEAAKID